MAKNYYVILGVSSEATPEQIRSAYRQRALELHPDRSGASSEPFIELQEAYSVLSDPQRRAAYDRELAGIIEVRHISRGPWTRPPEEVPAEAEPLVPPGLKPEPLRPVEPVTEFGEVDLIGDFETYRPSFDALFDRLWGNFLEIERPKAERLESLTVDIPLTPEQARRGTRVRLLIPVRGECPICRGRGAVGMFECFRCAGQGAIVGEAPLVVSCPPGIRNHTVVRLPLDQFGIENFYLTVRFRVSDGQV